MIGRVLALAAALASPAAAGQAQAQTQAAAKLRALDKITARLSAIEAQVGGVHVRFEQLEVAALRCEAPPPGETGSDAAFVEIREAKPGQQPRVVFRGWMFAASPALSALEHPIYDVWLEACR